MPELVPTWEHLTGLAGGGEEAARMLSLVRPAPYLTGCSQAVWTHRSPMLVRNYDYHPDAFEGAVVLTRWHSTRVLATSDCLWGALDGINEHGLCAALAFGGSRAVGPGLGIPLIVRYVLEFCRTVVEAAAVLRRIPSHMTYNVILLDASGDYAVAHLSPRRETEIVRERVCTNHQRIIEWPEHAALTRSQERHSFLKQRLNRLRSADRFLAEFLEPPLYAARHAEGYGTLYTVAYRPETGQAEFLWPQARVKQGIERFSEMELRVGFG
jgi:predicted choloylglycine hydrolase